MSQLNSNKNTAKKTFFMLLIFAIICAGVTVALIYNSLSLRKQGEMSKNSIQNTVSEETEKKSSSNKKSNIQKIKLTDKYSTNGITKENKRISLGDVIYEYEDDIERKLEISYVQISGLKNTTIQDKINKDIENVALSYRNDDELEDDSIHSINIFASVTANFSDVLSISVDKSISRIVGTDGEYERYDYEYEYVGLNYALETGEKIKFKELFTEDAPIKNIITQSIYEDLALNVLYSSNEMDLYMDKIDYSDIEAKSFKILSNFNKNPNIEYYFTQNQIMFIINNEYYSIDMEDFYEYIAIYTKFKSDNNLYKDESLINSVNYVFSDTDMSDKVYEAKKKTDNFYYEIFIYPTEQKSERYIEKEKEIQDIIEEKINNYAIIANENKDRGYIFSIIYYINENSKDENSNLTCNYTGYFSSMDKDYYNQHLEDLLAKERRSSHIELTAVDYSYIDKENVEFEEEIYRYYGDTSDDVEYITTKEDRLAMEQEFYQN